MYLEGKNARAPEKALQCKIAAIICGRKEGNVARTSSLKVENVFLKERENGKGR